MPEDRHTPALATALAAVQAELPTVRKGETGEISGQTRDGRAYRYTYRYADLATVSQAIMPLLGRNGLSFTAWTEYTEAGFFLFYSLMHESGEHRDGIWPLPKDASPQQLGSAITYARRYSLCAITGVAPDEDDDAAAAEQHARQGQQTENRQSEPNMDALEEALNITTAAANRKELAQAWNFAGGHNLLDVPVNADRPDYRFRHFWKDRQQVVDGLGQDTKEPPDVAPADSWEVVYLPNGDVDQVATLRSEVAWKKERGIAVGPQDSAGEEPQANPDAAADMADTAEQTIRDTLGGEVITDPASSPGVTGGE